jgi:hypothetical protein
MQKTEIIQLIRGRLEDNIRELTNSLETQRSASNIDEGDTKDPEDFSQQSESRDMEMGLQIQLDTANAQLSKLDDFSGIKTTSAEPGALVETDKNWFYLGISLSHMPVDDKELYGISPDSPAYNSIKGKSSGDHFTIGNNDHKILNVY